MTRWIALLRGINVGGANRLAMADLRSTIEQLGFTSVSTYIQSGNVIFDSSDDLGEPDLVAAIRSGLAEHHGVTAPVVVRTGEEFGRIALAHPAIGAGLDPKFLHVLFLDRPPSDTVVEPPDPARFAPDTWSVDGREIYLCYPNGSARSKLTIDVFERAYGVTATGRNLNTVRKLADLAGPGDAAGQN